MSPSTSITKDELTGDALQVRLMIEWAYANGIEMSGVAVGSCTVSLMPRRRQSSEPGPERPADTIYHQFGGDRIKDVVEMPGELEPAVGRR